MVTSKWSATKSHLWRRVVYKEQLPNMDELHSFFVIWSSLKPPSFRNAFKYELRMATLTGSPGKWGLCKFWDPIHSENLRVWTVPKWVSSLVIEELRKKTILLIFIFSWGFIYHMEWQSTTRTTSGSLMSALIRWVCWTFSLDLFAVCKRRYGCCFVKSLVKRRKKLEIFC